MYNNRDIISGGQRRHDKVYPLELSGHEEQTIFDDDISKELSTVDFLSKDDFNLDRSQASHKLKSEKTLTPYF